MEYGKNRYSAKCIRIIDGDTLYIDVDLGLRVHRKLYIRLVGIDAPEVRGSERVRGLASADYLRSLLTPGQSSRMHESLEVRFEKGKSFDRWLGRVFVDDGEDVVDIQKAMVDAGHAEWSK